MIDFPEQQQVPAGKVRIGLYDHHAYYQCEHMKDIAVLPIGSEKWTIVSEEPLTVVPSILNLTCQCHGFITNGEWIPV